ncbi:ABC1 kinase family protein [Raoultibacter phocaeensis]|uniref:ABC1 kinase family protein n=1 Tax=Raoultibacter phocaeensis TaxID=2479841 RepID=UPI00111B3AB5|nr:AarF/UbiB family protein [Raoultibacter phocaeensis]
MATFKEFLRVAEITVKDKTSGKRMKEIRHILQKHRVASGLTPEKAVAVLEDLGPTYVKIGQIASNRSDLLPKEYCDAFEKLRADVPPMPFTTVLERIEASIDAPWQTVFSAIEEKPLGSASIAQVHKAVLHDGTVVAVKVRRPGIAQQMAEDIMLMKHLLALAEFSNIAPDSLVLTADDLVSELERTTAEEVDFTTELNNLKRFHDEIQDQAGVTSPLPFPAYSTDSMLVMEYVTGTLLDDREGLIAQGKDLAAIGKKIAQSYVTQVIDDGFFHADPHPGNIMINERGIVWIDLGMTGSLTASERSIVNKVFRGVAENDPYALKDALLSLAKADGPVDHSMLLEQMSSMLSNYTAVDLSEINVGMAFVDVIEILRSQNLSLPSSFTMLARGFLTLEGVLAEIAPSISVVDIVSAHVKKQMLSFSSLEGKAKDLFKNTAASAEAMTTLPTQLSNTLDMLDRGQLKLSMDMKLPHDVKGTLYQVASLLALSLISAGLFVGSSIVCTTPMRPQIFDVPLLGALGYLGAFVLGVYVIIRAVTIRHQQVNDEKIK